MPELNIKSFFQKRWVWVGIVLLSFTFFGGGLITTLLFLLAIFSLSPLARKIFFNPLNLLILPYTVLLIGYLYRQNSVTVFMNIRDLVLLISIIFLLTVGVIFLSMRKQLKEAYLTNPKVIFLSKLVFLTILIIVFTNYSWAIMITLIKMLE